MGCSDSKVTEHIDTQESLRSVFTLVKPRQQRTKEGNQNTQDADDPDNEEGQRLLRRERGSGGEEGKEAEGERGVRAEEDEEEVEEEFPFITENSAPALVNEVIRSFFSVQDVSDLVVIGRECPRLLTSVQKTRAEEEQIIEKLRQEGLISKPLGRGTNGMSFEIIEEKEGMLDFGDHGSSHPLAIPQQGRNKFKRQLTTDSIAQKLERAQERRTQQVAEEEKERRLQTPRSRHLLVQARVQDRIQESEKLKLLQQVKWEQGLKKREEHLSELRDKLREKHERIKAQTHETHEEDFFD